MANEMTVEELVELLKEQYPQSLIMVEEPLRYEGVPRTLTLLKLQPARDGCVYIICKESFRR